MTRDRVVRLVLALSGVVSAVFLTVPQMMGLWTVLALFQVGKGLGDPRVTAALLVILLLQIACPPIELLARFPFLLAAVCLSVSGAILGWRRNLLLPDRWAKNVSSLLPPLVPLLLGMSVSAGFLLSGLDLPASMIPWGGLLVALGLTSLWATLYAWGQEMETKTQKEILWLGMACASFSTVWLSGNVLQLVRQIPSQEMALESTSKTWGRLVEEAENLGLAPLENFVRTQALAAEAIRSDTDAWIDIAKGTAKGAIEGIEPPSALAGLLARGGRVFDQPSSETGREERAVGMTLLPSPRQLVVLSASGTVVCVSDTQRLFRVSPQVGPFVHGAQGQDGSEVLLLEAGGRLLAFRPDLSGATHEVCPTLYGASAATFRRVCVDPSTGVPWALDLFGYLYRATEQGWRQDDRFVRVSRRGEIEVDVARDIAITSGGTLALLAADGEIWKSSLDGVELVGPIRGTHYFPDFAVAQSIEFAGNRLSLVDRYGGFFHSPYPTDRSTLRHRFSYRFPRSLPIREDSVRAGHEVVDHFYLPEKGWLCLLTGRGRILTNYRWERIWSL